MVKDTHPPPELAAPCRQQHKEDACGQLCGLPPSLPAEMLAMLSTTTELLQVGSISARKPACNPRQLLIALQRMLQR